MAEEAKERKIEVEATEGRKDEVEEGSRKERREP